MIGNLRSISHVVIVIPQSILQWRAYRVLMVARYGCLGLMASFLIIIRLNIGELFPEQGSLGLLGGSVGLG